MVAAASTGVNRRYASRELSHKSDPDIWRRLIRFEDCIAENRCRWANVPEAEAMRLITEGMTRPPSPANEVITAVRKAYCSNWQPSQSGKSFSPRPVSLVEIKLLKAMAEKICAPKNWRHFLRERSPKRPDAMNAASFISNLYQPDEQVLVFDVFETKSPVAVVKVTEPMDCRRPCSNRGRRKIRKWHLVFIQPRRRAMASESPPK